ncbi:MAG: zinc-binding alcohol dehydrogenase family protein, partial [Burkholderiales bacterium]|nr:zinc-binding alcohol dehydrogenase family protein [Opitutaceae bacterium]
APGQFSYGEKNAPTTALGEVLLRIRRFGFFGSDLSTFRGGNPLVTYPRIPGHEIAAVIEAVTPGVPATFAVGDPVTVMPYTTCGRCSSCRQKRFNACRHNQTLGVQQDGAATDHIVTKWENLIPSQGLGLRELALVEPLAVGFHAVARGRVTPADTVLVFGCGMIGLGAIAAAGLHRGSTVIAIDIEDTKLAVAKKAGATHVINSKTENLHVRLQALTQGHGPDVAIEAVGNPATFTAAVDEVCFAGRVVYIGYAKAPVSYETKYFVMKELDILGSRNSTPEDFRDVVAMLASGRYPIAETITRTVPFAQAGEALADWSANPGAITKIHVEL